MSHFLRRLKYPALLLSVLLVTCLLAMLAAAPPAQADSTIYAVAGSGTWIAPPGVTSIAIECWGGGGGGGSDLTSIIGGGGGGGGGAYARVNTFAVIPGNPYSYVVGAGGSTDTAGEASSFNGTTCAAAGGGAGSSGSPGAGGAGGSAAASTGDVIFAGGSGSIGMGISGGGGGGSAGSDSAGASAVSSITGAAVVTGGGPGGNGGASAAGFPPAAGPGGGGGGGEYIGSGSGGIRSGGAGFAGQIRITMKVVPTLAVTNLPATYNGAPQEASLSALAAAQTVAGTFSNIKYNGSTTVPVAAGTYLVTADFTPADPIAYIALTAAPAGNFTIAKAPTTSAVTCGAGPFVYTGAAIKPCTAKVTGAGNLDHVLAVTYAANVNAGTAAASAGYAETANYLASSDSKNFTIAKAPTTSAVTCGTGPFTYTGAAIEPCTAKVTGAGGLDVALVVTYAANTNAGTATASASFAESANHLTSSDSKTFTIDQATPTLAVTNSPAAYDGTPRGADVKGSVGGAVTNVLYNGAAAAPTNAGTYAITADFTPDDAINYKPLIAAPAGSFVVEKAGSPVLAITNPTVTYNGTPQAAVVVGSAAAQMIAGTPSNVKYNGSTTVPVDAGVYIVTADFTPADVTNYDSVSGMSAGTFTIAKAPSTSAVTCSTGPFVYTGGAIEPCTAKVTGAGDLDQDLAVTYAANVNAGTAAASAGYAETANYLASSDSENFTIDQATPTLSVTNSPAAYDGTPHTVIVAGSVAGAVTNVLYNGAAAAPADAGTYAVTADFTPEDITNYRTLIAAPAGSFVIAQAGSLVLAIANPTVTYNGTPQAAVVVGSVPGTPGSIKYNGSTTVPSAAGTYLVTADFIPADAINYSSVSGVPAGTYTIAKAPSTTAVTCNAGPFIYTGAAIKPCTAKVVGAGRLNHALAVVYTGNVAIGTATASASYPGGANYLASSDSEVFVIGEAAQVILHLPFAAK